MKKVILILLFGIVFTNGASTKKNEKDTEVDSGPPGPAILAIEIVDGDDNSTDVRNNTKRTIESALGYGYQGNYYTTRHGKKYMIYPYSQHNIPAPSPKYESSKYLSPNLEVQKSISYNLGTKIESVALPPKQLFTPTNKPSTYNQVVQPSGNYYPSTLFSTVGQSGIGGLSPNFPLQQTQAPHTVPVIILRVYSNQLTEPNIYPNLPQTHPYANNLNSINLQSILQNYINQYLQQHYKQTGYQSQGLTYQSQDQGYQNQHTGYQTQDLGYQGQNIDYQSQGQDYQTQAGYQVQSNYPYYHQDQSQFQDQQPQVDAAASLPTHENYPDDAHTRVVYHGPKGHLNKGVSYTSGAQDFVQESTPKTQYIYTDSNGQKFIYVKPSQLQGQQYQQQDYQQEYQQEYQQPEPKYETNYEVTTDRQYLPPAIGGDKYLPSASDKYTPPGAVKHYNYHAHSSLSKDRSKKASGSPVTFESNNNDVTKLKLTKKA